jgi:VWFA-related protein
MYNLCRDEFWQAQESKALVILTDGQDNASRTTLTRAIWAAQDTSTVVYMLLFQSPWSQLGGHRPDRSGEIARKISAETGGFTYVIENDKQFAAAFDKLAAHFKSLYSLSFDTQALPHDGKFRKITVKCTRPDVKVLAQTGYYSPKR